jgi:hypothetical protein
LHFWLFLAVVHHKTPVAQAFGVGTKEFFQEIAYLVHVIVHRVHQSVASLRFFLGRSGGGLERIVIFLRGGGSGGVNSEVNVVLCKISQQRALAGGVTVVLSLNIGEEGHMVGNIGWYNYFARVRNGGAPFAKGFKIGCVKRFQELQHAADVFYHRFHFQNAELVVVPALFGEQKAAGFVRLRGGNGRSVCAQVNSFLCKERNEHATGAIVRVLAGYVAKEGGFLYKVFRKNNAAHGIMVLLVN